jgi:hypothetical protein
MYWSLSRLQTSKFSVTTFHIESVYIRKVLFVNCPCARTAHFFVYYNIYRCVIAYKCWNCLISLLAHTDEQDLHCHFYNNGSEPSFWGVLNTCHRKFWQSCKLANRTCYMKTCHNPKKRNHLIIFGALFEKKRHPKKFIGSHLKKIFRTYQNNFPDISHFFLNMNK